VGALDTAYDGTDVTNLEIRLSDDMLDLDQSVVVTINGAERSNYKVSRTVLNLAKILEERGDPRMTWSAELDVAF
jgi:hypothetical protein